VTDQAAYVDAAAAWQEWHLIASVVWINER
jgi:hypothetical protein